MTKGVGVKRENEYFVLYNCRQSLAQQGRPGLDQLTQGARPCWMAEKKRQGTRTRQELENMEQGIRQCRVQAMGTLQLKQDSLVVKLDHIGLGVGRTF